VLHAAPQPASQFAAYCSIADIETEPVRAAARAVAPLQQALQRGIALAGQQHQAWQDAVGQGKRKQAMALPSKQQQRQQQPRKAQPEDGSEVSPLTTFASLLQAFSGLGGVLSTLPAKGLCSNPWCLNVSGASELSLLSCASGGAPGRAACGGCGRAEYCSRECQLQHWTLHKQVCRAATMLTAESDGTASHAAGQQ
jgi:hypothetical protein